MNLFFIFLLPLTMNMIYILNESTNINPHALVKLGNCFIFINLILLLDSDNDQNYVDRIAKLLIMVQLFIYATLANQCYLQMNMAYENTYAFYEGIVSTITQTEGFDAETKIVIIGEYKSKELNQMEQFDNHFLEMTGVATSHDLIYLVI